MTVQHLLGDVFEQLATLPDNHFDCVVTSPPYWGLRDYGVDGQIGLEPTLAEHIDVMVRVCAEIHRVLKPEGTFWLNYGDCHAANRGGTHQPAETLAGGRGGKTNRSRPEQYNPSRHPDGLGLKHKDLVMVPNRVAIALQEWGWWVRSEIIWAKPNPMPESVTDRPATSHEKIFMLTKSAKYFYDAEAVRVPSKTNGIYKTPDGWDTGPGAHGTIHRNGSQKGETVKDKKSISKSTLQDGAAGRCERPDIYPERERREKQHRDKQRGHGRRHAGFNDRWDQMSKTEQTQDGRNLRNYEPAPMQVWNIATKPFKDAHFATFPPELVERCLTAGCPVGGRVLDPFGGAGTTGLVADRMQRHATLIELNPDYQNISLERINTDRGGLLDAMEGVE